MRSSRHTAPSKTESVRPMLDPKTCSFNGITLAMGEAGLLPPLIASGHPLVVFAAIAASVAYWQKLKPRPAQHDGDNIKSKLP